MTKADVCVVVPTIRRPECVRAYVENAREHGFDTDRLHVVLVTESFCDVDAMEAMLEDLGVEGEVFDEDRRADWFAQRDLAEYDHLIPAASHAQTSFGLLYCWAGDYPYCTFIDDDTLPHDDVDFFGRHLANLAYEGDIEAVESDERWVNVLYQNVDKHGLYPRGYPYSAMDERVETETTAIDGVVASQGLWTNVPDLDAVRILMDGDLQGQAQTRTTTEDYDGDFVAAREQYLTVCSMNLAFRREVIPAFYQFPMDDNQWEVGRFDDIWSGVVLKRACDVVGTRIYNGDPLCEHNKAPRSTFDDLTNEVNGLECNEHVWEVVDRAEPAPEALPDATTESASERPHMATLLDRPVAETPHEAAPAAYAAVAAGVAAELQAADVDDWQNGDFLHMCGEYLADWLDCLAAIDPEPFAVAAEPAAVADD